MDNDICHIEEESVRCKRFLSAYNFARKSFKVWKEYYKERDEKVLSIKIKSIEMVDEDTYTIKYEIKSKYINR